MSGTSHDSLMKHISPQMVTKWTEQHKNHQKRNGFDIKNFLIHRIWCHLVTQYSAANGNKQISWAHRMMYERFTELCLMTRKLYKFQSVKRLIKFCIFMLFQENEKESIALCILSIVLLQYVIVIINFGVIGCLAFLSYVLQPLCAPLGVPLSWSCVSCVDLYSLYSRVHKIGRRDVL
jgi:hypothetical protein